MRIPFKRLDFSDAIPRVNAMLKSGFIGLGSEVLMMEKKIAEFLGCKYIVSTDSCTSALFLSMKYENQNFVVIPSMTVPLVANAAKEAGKNIYFNDAVEWVGSGYHIINSHVYDFAHQFERDLLKDFYDRHFKACFSFYPTKPIGSADGGCIATNDEYFYHWSKSMTTYGRNVLDDVLNSWEYDTIRIGYKRHYTNIQAAIVLSQLEKIDKINERRIQVRDRFNEAFQLNNKSLYLYRVDVPDRDLVIRNLKEKGIECGVHFKPLHLMTAYKNINFYYGCDSEKVNKKYKTTISIPFFGSMTEDEQNYVIENIKNLLIEKQD